LNSRTWGKLNFEVASFTPATDGDLVVTIGEPFTHPRPLVRIHSECVFAEAFDSDFCDCADQLKLALSLISSEGNGILFYLRFDGRGAGLAAKVKATALEMNGIDTFSSRQMIGVPPEGRSFQKIGVYLQNKNIDRVRLLTNNPDKGNDLIKCGIDVEYIPLLVCDPNKHIRDLYKTKKGKFNHIIPNGLT
jgi:GTP cyclohydrolase II